MFDGQERVARGAARAVEVPVPQCEITLAVKIEQVEIALHFRIDFVLGYLAVLVLVVEGERFHPRRGFCRLRRFTAAFPAVNVDHVAVDHR